MGCLGLFRQVKFSVRLQHSVRFLHNSEGNLIYGKSIQGECSENALVYFHCRAAVYCVLHNSKEMKILYDWRGMVRQEQNSLNYFGARYLDPMLGVWTSVDPMRQFSSPYLYAENGANPVNGVDPDGNSDIVVLRPGTNDISNVIHIDDSFNLVGLVSDESTEYYDAPPKDSYFYTEILIGQKFDPDMDQKARILIKDAYEQGPLAFYKWGEKGSLDFKNSAYSGADKTIGVLNRTIMTARDAGNAIWAGWTRYSYLNVINPIPERYSVKLNYVGMVILRDGYAIIQNALKREFKTEDPASAVMQKWGYYNYQP